MIGLYLIIAISFFLQLRLFGPTDTAGPIVNVLRQASCCSRCILRYLGEKNIEVYQQPRQVCIRVLHKRCHFLCNGRLGFLLLVHIDANQLGYKGV